MTNAPRVSIGVPVYNGAGHVQRALESLLAQTFADFEVVVSDNASSDATEVICRAFAARDPRVRYLRQQANLGATRNFELCLEQARGEYWMWLASDDSIDPDYVRRCVQCLDAEAACVLVAGSVVYRTDDGATSLGSSVSLLQDSGPRRVLAYARNVGDNGVFYGLYRRAAAARGRLRHSIGADWAWVAEIAFLGKIRVLEDVHVHRHDGWRATTPHAYYRRLVRLLGAPRLLRATPRLAAAWTVGASLATDSPALLALPPLRRWSLAAAVAIVLASRLSWAAMRGGASALRSRWRDAAAAGGT